MAAAFPYAHYACPCSDLTGNPVAATSASAKRASIIPASSVDASLQIDQDRAFNSHDPRANYTLYPLDQLLYCDECDAVRCPRCWTEEVLYWYCPSCLFEVPSSGVRGDGNRCCRSCYNCPSCASSLSTVALPPDPAADDGLLKPGGDSRNGESYILQCQYCEWNSLELDMQFSMPKNITGQMVKLRKARASGNGRKGSGTSTTETTSPIENQMKNSAQTHESAFADMVTFYKGQLNESSDLQNPFASSPYNSPANLARIMSLYGGLSYSALKKSREKSQPMREAKDASEGLRTYTVEVDSTDDLNNDDESEIIERMQEQGWEGLSSHSQRVSAPANYDAKFTSELWPTATPLRTRRGRRCNVCRQFLARPDPKVSSMRYRIRLLAVNFLPRLSVKPLAQSSVPFTNPAFQLRKETSSAADEFTKLKPGTSKQYILTLRNPIFETVHITLATPTTTPGRVASRVTILCPSFDVGPAGDVWDEALAAPSSTTAGSTAAESGGRIAAMASLTGTRSNDASGEPKQPEAGKVWERTRNSTSVIVEITPGSRNTVASSKAQQLSGDGGQNRDSQQESMQEEEGVDEDVLEVPVYVRAEWEAEVKEGESSMGKKDVERRPGEKVKKELGYWVVLGLGRIVG